MTVTAVSSKSGRIWPPLNRLSADQGLWNDMLSAIPLQSRCETNQGCTHTVASEYNCRHLS
jgi:hypothetical protein